MFNLKTKIFPYHTEVIIGLFFCLFALSIYYISSMFMTVYYDSFVFMTLVVINSKLIKYYYHNKIKCFYIRESTFAFFKQTFLYCILTTPLLFGSNIIINVNIDKILKSCFLSFCMVSIVLTFLIDDIRNMKKVKRLFKKSFETRSNGLDFTIDFQKVNFFLTKNTIIPENKQELIGGQLRYFEPTNSSILLKIYFHVNIESSYISSLVILEDMQLTVDILSLYLKNNDLTLEQLMKSNDEIDLFKMYLS